MSSSTSRTWQWATTSSTTPGRTSHSVVTLDQMNFDVADPATTGQIMQFRVVPAVAPDPTTPPRFLVLPPVTPLPRETVTRRLALIEELSRFFSDTPVETELGSITWDSRRRRRHVHKHEWRGPVSEKPQTGATEVWELYNVTADAHPIHIHEVVFEVVNRQDIVVIRGSEAGSNRPLVSANAAGAFGNRLQRYGDCLPRPGNSRARTVQYAGPVRLALPHRRTRGQRDDAALPDRPGTTGATGIAAVRSGEGVPESCSAATTPDTDSR